MKNATAIISRWMLALLLAGSAAWAAGPSEPAEDALAAALANPPAESRPWCYWWWLHGNASREGITHDFEEMKRQGIGGALLFDAGEAGPDVPRGPQFMSDPWRELFRHAVREADRCGIALSVNLCSGWDCGGPWVTPEHAAKKLVFERAVASGPGHVAITLPRPPATQNFYQDIVVLAAPAPDHVVSSSQEGSSPQSDDPEPPWPWDRSRAVDVTDRLDENGALRWDVPPGLWQIVRVGYTLHGDLTKCVGSGPAGLEIDPMSAAAMDAHFAETGAKLITDAGEFVHRTLQYFHIDSWELGQPTWTPRMREEFQQRRGYDPLPWLPAVLGLADDQDPETNRFVHDYRRTAADLVAANYYGRLRELTLRGDLRGTHPEAGGPFFDHWIDALQCLGISDVPMGEFWKRNVEPDGPITWPARTNPSVKQAACAAHIYGEPVCQAEAFTAFACDWTANPWNMKDIGDAAFCDGLTRNVLCFWVHQPRRDAKPGFQWAHVGTHFDSNVTWWPMADAWLTYLARCQHVLRQGQFVADFVYLQDENIPSFIPPRPDQRPLGFDYDVLNAEVLLSRATAREGRLVLSSGMSYRYLALPQRPDAILAAPTLKKVQELAEAGVTIIGPPTFAGSVTKLRDGPWAAVARADGLQADVEFRNASPEASFDWIHRRAGETEIYFVSNQCARQVEAQVAFRVAGKQPELWDAVTGRIRDLPDFCGDDGRTVVPLQFAPRQSWFVVFRRPGVPPAIQGSPQNFPALQPVQEVTGRWDLSFDPEWFYPDDGSGGQVGFDTLDDWSQRPEEGIRCYSGTATYRTTFDSHVEGSPFPIYLDLGVVHSIARVRLNDHDLGVVWTAPWRVEVTTAIRPGANALEIDVANLWPNRLIGDATLPANQRRTVTNVRTYDTMASGTYGCPRCAQRKSTGQPAELLPAGLLGPVTLQTHRVP